MIQITLPTDISFNVDQNAVLESNGYNQITDATGSYTVVNNGAAVKLSVIDLAGVTNTVTLGDNSTAPFEYLATFAQAGNLTASTGGNRAGAMVSLWLPNDLAPHSQSDLENRAITTGLDASNAGTHIEIGTVNKNTSETLQVYCYAKTNFTGQTFKFSITPVIKVESTT